MDSPDCPIYKATGGKAKLEEECEVCPFKDNCIEDIFNDATAKVIGVLGGYLDKQRGEQR